MLESMKRNSKARRKSRRGKQLGLRLLRGRGGPGRGQGRPKTKFNYVPHVPRAFLDKSRPVHVSTKVVSGLPSLRGRKLWAAVRRAFVFGCVFRAAKHEPQKAIFRIVHFSVQGQHIHLICEAKNRRALSRGIQGFKIRVAKRINAALGGRRGAVFSDRYHERIITNPTQCRHTLAYVLSNRRHRAYEQVSSYPRGCVDPCSSAIWFDGWTVRNPRVWANAPPTALDDQAPVAPPATWLLRGGWKRGGGTISPSRIPGLPRDAPPLPVW